MNNTTKKELQRIINMSELNPSAKSGFFRHFEALDSKTQISLFAILLQSPKKINSMWNLVEAKLNLIRKISQIASLTEKQKDQLKKNIIKLNADEIEEIHKILSGKSHLNEIEEKLFGKNDGHANDLPAVLAKTKELLRSFLDSKLKTAEKKRMEEIRRKINISAE